MGRGTLASDQTGWVGQSFSISKSIAWKMDWGGDLNPKSPPPPSRSAHGEWLQMKRTVRFRTGSVWPHSFIEA